MRINMKITVTIIPFVHMFITENVKYISNALMRV